MIEKKRERTAFTHRHTLRCHVNPVNPVYLCSNHSGDSALFGILKLSLKN
jgi:hypothetical protein